MVNPGEWLLNAVRDDRPKMLSGLGPKGMGTSGGAPNSPPADDAPPAERQDLNPSFPFTVTGNYKKRAAGPGQIWGPFRWE